MSSSAPSRKLMPVVWRYLFVLMLGFLSGLIATVMGIRALQARADHFPDALMQVMARQQHLLAESHRQNRCTISDALPRLQSLRAMANDLEQAFPDLATDNRFQDHASQFRANLDAALAAVPNNCAALELIVKQSGEGCQNCHRQFR